MWGLGREHLTDPRHPKAAPKAEQMSAPDTHHANPRSLLRSGRPQMLRKLVAVRRTGTFSAYLGIYKQAVSRPLPHGELVERQRSASSTRLFADLARQRGGVACPEAGTTGAA
jgi:hypothetical protein